VKKSPPKQKEKGNKMMIREEERAESWGENERNQ